MLMEHWGFTYKTNVVWYKVRKDGGPDPSLPTSLRHRPPLELL